MTSDRKPQPIEYLPPSREVVHQFAQAVCASLAQRNNNPTVQSKESVAGLAQFLEVITRIQAKYLSSENQGLIDSDPKCE